MDMHVSTFSNVLLFAYAV